MNPPTPPTARSLLVSDLAAIIWGRIYPERAAYHTLGADAKAEWERFVNEGFDVLIGLCDTLTTENTELKAKLAPPPPANVVTTTAAHAIQPGDWLELTRADGKKPTLSICDLITSTDDIVLRDPSTWELARHIAKQWCLKYLWQPLTKLWQRPTSPPQNDPLESMLDGLATVDGLAPDSRALITLAAENETANAAKP
ncbi:MAG: hypothetical protein ACOYMN_19745 [Roseimicrobium sp.]